MDIKLVWYEPIELGSSSRLKETIKNIIGEDYTLTEEIRNHTSCKKYTLKYKYRFTSNHPKEISKYGINPLIRNFKDLNFNPANIKNLKKIKKMFLHKPCLYPPKI